MNDQPVMLSTRERQVLQGLADGLTAGEIANLYQVKISSIRMYMTRARKKAKIRNIVGLALWALQNGYIQFGPTAR